MSAVLDSIRIQNSFAHKDTTIKFKSGLNYIVGPNGSGKSEILEMIGFAFFGVVALRDKAASYKKLNVETVFNFNDQKFKITRMTSDAVFYMYDLTISKYVQMSNGTTTVNQSIINLLGYDYSVYELSNYCQQDELQYISKMTPAKRIAFIDKVSGIDDAKELLAWLDDRRKTLSVEINTLNRTLIKPLDVTKTVLETDYVKLIKELDTKIFEFTDLEKQQSILETKINQVNKKPEISTRYDVRIGSLSEESYLEILENYDKINNLEMDMDVADEKLTPYLHLHKQYSDYTEETLVEAKATLVNNEKYKSKLKLINLGKIDCPKCTHEFHLSHSALQAYDGIEEQVIYFNQKQIDELEEYLSFNDLEVESLKYEAYLLKKQYDDLLKQIPDYTTQLTKREFTSLYKHNKDILSEYNERLNGWIEASSKIEEYKLELERISEIVKEINLKSLFTEKENMIKNQFLKNEYTSKIETYHMTYTLVEQYKKNLATTVESIKKAKEDSETIKNGSIPLINYHSSLLLNEMTNGEMLKIEVKDNYDIIVDEYDIKLKSGSEKDIASLAFRLSLGNSVIPSMLPLFIGDEIDHSSSDERTEYVTEALNKLSKKGYQLILITHKSLDNLEDGNIIDLSKI